MGNTTGVSDTNGVQTGKINYHHRSYDEYTRETIKYSINSPQDCVVGNQIPGVPGRDKRMVLLRAT